MKKSLFDTSCSAKTIQRIMAIAPETTALWGSMDAVKMLQHCRIINETILSGKTSDRKPGLKLKLIKFVIVHVLKKIPKNARTPRIIREETASQICLAFEEEKLKLMATVTAINQNKQPLLGAHPVFGPMDNEEWGTFSWIHLNHHLKQFGV